MFRTTGICRQRSRLVPQNTAEPDEFFSARINRIRGAGAGAGAAGAGAGAGAGASAGASACGAASRPRSRRRPVVTRERSSGVIATTVRRRRRPWCCAGADELAEKAACFLALGQGLLRHVESIHRRVALRKSLLIYNRR